MNVTFEDRRLEPIREKVHAGARLSYEDGVTLFRTNDLLALGYMANIVRERKHGDLTYFNVNRHINPTDVCVASCRLCAFGKQKRDPNSYTMSLEQVWETAGTGLTEAVTEFHIVGGLCSGTDDVVMSQAEISAEAIKNTTTDVVLAAVTSSG